MRMPGDKSISHRAVILAALADGTSIIRDLLESTDVLATVSAFRQLGVKIEGPRDGALWVDGVGLDGLSAPTRPLDMGNSGTAMRLLAGVLVGQDFESTLVGDASLSQRPMGRIIDPLTRMGAKISGVQDDTPPLKIRPTKALRAIDYSMPVASAQVKSALLLAGAYANGATTITESAVTRDHTERMLTGFKYSGQVGRQPIKIEGRGRLSACEITVPGDLSSAAFFVVGATISEGSSVRLENIGINGTRSGVLDILREMGANIQLESKRVICGEEVADLVISHSSLNGISIGPELVSRSIDEFPAIAIAAACATGRTTIRGAEELRVKETDRIRAVVQGLNTLNIEAVELEDGMVITGGELKSGNVNSFQDHRIAMAFSIAGAATQGSIRIADCGNVETSFPDFVSQAAGCGLNIIEQPGDIA
tara:strand:+ start:1622 stop:2893 length:1272 start_codon:yes stop_codon:yes gene_type:complete